MTQPEKNKYPKWRNQAPVEVIDEIRMQIRVSPSGNIQVPGFEFPKLVTFLRLAIEFDPSIVATEAEQIVHTCLEKVAGSGTINEGRLLEAARKEQEKQLRAQKNFYEIVTNINIQWGSHLRATTINGVRIRFRANLPNKYDRSGQENLAIQQRMPKALADSIWVIAGVHARTKGEALTVATRAIEFMVGVWNLDRNTRQDYLFRNDWFSPLNMIFPGPLYTLHDSSGTAVQTETWYEANYPRQSIELVDVTNIWKDLREAERKVKLRLKKKTSTDLFQGFIREYSAALNYSDMSVAFTSLWRCLERFTFLTRNENSKDAIRRASFLFTERNYTMEILQRMSEVRNDIIHHGIYEPQVKMLVEELRKVVEYLLRFHLFNPHGLNQDRDFRDFLDLPYRREELNREINVRQKARRFRST